MTDIPPSDIDDDDLHILDADDDDFESSNDQAEALDLSAEDRKLVTQPDDLAVKGISSDIDTKRISLTIEYQRKYVWDLGKASRLIESLLLNVPIPVWNDSAKLTPGTLKAEKLSRVITSAKAEKIDTLFSLMGSKAHVCDGDIDLTAPADEMISLNIRLALADVVQCRNDIAHGESSRKPTQEDIDRYLLFLAALARRLQRKADGLSAAFLP